MNAIIRYLRVDARRLALVVLCLTLAAVACDRQPESVESQPAGETPESAAEEPAAQETAAQGPADQEAPAGYQAITPDQPAQVTAEGGAVLDIPQGAYDELTAVGMALLPESPLPTVTNLHNLISAPYELDQAGFADQVRPLTLRIAYDPAALPQGASPQALTIVWWDGESWRDVPSTVDEERVEITAEIDHFSTFAAAWSRFQEMTAQEGYFDDGHVRGPFTIRFTTLPPAEQSSFWPWHSAARDDRPILTDDNDNGLPDYVEDLGQSLVESRDALSDLLDRQGLRFPAAEMINVYVADIEPAAGFYDPVSQRIVIDNDVALNVTAAHELFHYVQYAQLPRAAADKHRWWTEATAEWAEDLVYEEVNAYYDSIRAWKPNPAREGFGQLRARDYLEYYAASSLVHYLEMRYPNFVLASLNPQSGLSQDESWYAAFERILSDKYGAAFDEVMDDYFASYFYHWDFDDDGHAVFDVEEPAWLADPLLLADPGMYTRVSQELPPISGRLVTVEAGGDLGASTLVVRQGGQGQTAFVYAFADARDNLARARVSLPNSLERQGVLLGAYGETLAVAGFGSAQSGQPVNQVHLVATNANPRQNLGLDLEIYVLEPPAGLTAADPEADPLQLSWFPSKLPVGETADDQGALGGYRLYSQIPGQAPAMVTDGIEATATSLTIARGELGLGRETASLFMRAVDKYGNESPDSEMLAFGASLRLAAATAGESNCFVSTVNDWEYCDITVALLLEYNATQTPATITCVLASSEEGASTVVDVSSGTAQLGFTDTAVRVENRETYPVLNCTIEPGDFRLILPYNNGTFSVPE